MCHQLPNVSLSWLLSTSTLYTITASIEHVYVSTRYWFYLFGMFTTKSWKNAPINFAMSASRTAKWIFMKSDIHTFC